MWTWAKKGVTFSRNPLFYLVELAGVEPASEISTYHFYISKNIHLRFKSLPYCFLCSSGFM